MTIPDLRVQIALQLGYIDQASDGSTTLNGQPWTGQPTDYQKLTPTQQITLTDAMVKYVADHKDQFSAPQVQVAQQRMADPMYGQPLANTSYINTTWELLKSGQLQDAIFGGAASYTKTLAEVAVGVAVLVGMIWLLGKQK